MIITVPPHVDRLMRERSYRYDCPYINAEEVYRSLLEAWTEGVMHAWTIQDIENS